MSADAYVLAHSHGVAFMDAATDWRSRFRGGAALDPRYGEAFQGWYGGAIPDGPIDVSAVGCTRLRKVTAWVMPITSGQGILVNPVRDSRNAVLSVQVDATFAGVIRSWGGDTPIVSMIRGNDHALMMLGRYPAYDFLDPAVPGVAAGVPILDEALIERHVEPWADGVFYALAVVRREVRNPVLHVLPPPPREHPERARHLEEVGELVREHGFVPAALRLKWHRRYARQLAARLAAIGCATLAPPAGACTADGLLREEYAEGLTHGNRRYGELVAAQVEAWIGGLAR